eukprot:TRINITY_DN5273_c0_g2_i1.p1 TRINITY_DN5273_c0_g2~~TRINITY_DN5273_c0_g2_i1.p1  ORF type:complete len:1010 (+),score=280.65 TRINITY_DN5273_c0_g2_i1:55-3084(+)
MLAVYLGLVAAVAAGDVYQGRMTAWVDDVNKVQVDISEEDDKVFITVEGPASAWFGVGFNGSMMSGTYAIIVDGYGQATERVLGDHDPGTQLSDNMITVVDYTVVNGVRTVLLSRALEGVTPDHYTFTPNDGTPYSIPFIAAFGNTIDLNFHYGNFDSNTLNFAPTTRIFTAPASKLISFSLAAYSSPTEENQVALTLVGPAPFTLTIGDAGYQIQVNTDSVIELINGKVLPPMLAVDSITSNNVSTIVKVTRQMEGLTQEYFSWSFGTMGFNYMVDLGNSETETGFAQMASVLQTTGYVKGMMPVDVSVAVDQANNEVTIVMTAQLGASDYMAVGFNGSQMSDAPWTLIITPDNEDSKILEAHTYATPTDRGVTPVQLPTPNIMITSSSWSNGRKTVTVTRPLLGSHDTFDFSAGYRHIDVISATGPFTGGAVQFHTANGGATIKLSHASVYTTVLANSYTNGNITAYVTVDELKDTVNISMVGPADRWFGIGFGNDQMANTYSIIAGPDGIVETVLNGRTSSSPGPGSDLPPSVTVLAEVRSGDKRYINMSRPIMYGKGYFNFMPPMMPPHMTTALEVISAVGSTLGIAYHDTSRQMDTLGMAAGYSPPPTPPPATPAPPTTMPTPSPATPPGTGCTKSDLYMNETGNGPMYDCMMGLADQLSIHWTWDNKNTVYMALRSTQESGWVGLTVAQDKGLMIPAKGVIGLMQGEGTSVQSYNVTQRAQSGVVPDNNQQLLSSSLTYVNGIQTLRFVRALNNGGYVIDPKVDTYFNYARNQGTEVAGHPSNTWGRGSTAINFASGAHTVVSSPLRSKRLAHGWLMLIAWMWIVPGGVWIKRFGKPLLGMGISQYYAHIALMLIAVAMTVVAYFIAVGNSFGQGYKGHGTIGVVLFVMACLNPIIGLLGYIFVRDPKHPKRWLFRFVHLLIGRSVYLLAILQVMFGIQSLYDVEQISRGDFYGPALAGVGVFLAAFAVAQVRLQMKQGDEANENLYLRSGTNVVQFGSRETN